MTRHFLKIAPIVVLFLVGHPAAALINPLPLIAQYESGGNPTAKNPKSTSSGLYGMINTTWGQALQLCNCGTTDQYPTEASAPSSVQTAAASALIDNQGLQAWLCDACDPAFAAQVAADGGGNAFQLEGLSIDPATYAALDGGESVSALLGDGGGGGDAGGVDGGTVGGAAAGGPGLSTLPFEWFYNQIINGIMNQIDSSIQVVEGIVTGPSLVILALAIAIMGFMTMFGNMDQAVFMSFAIRAAVIMAFISTGNTYYHDWVETPVLGIPAYFANAFSLTNAGGTPAQLFDQLLNGWVADAVSTWHATSWVKAIWVGGCLVALSVFVVVPSLVAMFTVFMISTFLLLVMLVIGPLMILGLLFRTTHRFLHGYVNVLVTGIIFALVVDIVLGIFSSILSQVMANFTPTDSPDTNLPGLFGLAATMMITGFTMGRLPRLVEAIGGGVAVSMDAAGRYVAGGFAADAAPAAAKLAMKAI